MLVCVIFQQIELSINAENIWKRQCLLGSLQLLPGALISICKAVTQKGQSVKSDFFQVCEHLRNH